MRTGTIAEIMGPEPIEFYIAQRFAKWLGHLARMSEDRLPKKLLLAWPKGGQVQAPNPKGPHHPPLLRSPGGVDAWLLRHVRPQTHLLYAECSANGSQ